MTPVHAGEADGTDLGRAAGTAAARLTRRTVEAGGPLRRPAGTGIAHEFLAGPQGLSSPAFGTRLPADTCFHPGSGASLRALGVILTPERTSSRT